MQIWNDISVSEKENTNDMNNAIGKIVITTHTYYPNKNGVAIVNEYLTKGLRQKGYKIIVITHSSASLAFEEEHEGIKIVRAFNESRPYDYVDYVKKCVEEQDILINICTQTPTTDLLLSELENIKCRKKILYVHGIWHFYWTPLNYANLHNFLSKIYKIGYNVYTNNLRGEL